MMTSKHTIILTVLTIISSSSFSFGQSIDKSFSGSWGRTYWSFEFNKDNSYKRTSSGHFGNTSYEGTYEMIEDTIYLITGSEGISGIQGPKYLLEKDSFLIDLQLYYDYKLDDKNRNYYNSRERNDILKKVKKSN